LADIYRAEAEQGYDFAFDATGHIIDWSRVAEAARSGRVRLTLELAMQYTKEGEVRRHARVPVSIPRYASEEDIRRQVYSATREYVRSSARMSRAEEAGYDSYDEYAESEDYYDTGGDEDLSEADTVALISAVRM